MEQFELTIVRQSRVLIALLLFGLSLAGAIYLSTLFESSFFKIVVPILGFIGLNFLTFYSAYGRLIIVAKEGLLSFTWTEKLFLNFPPIEDINLKEVKTIILDKNDHDPLNRHESLREIITNDRNVLIESSGKLWKKDSDDLIRYLKIHTNASIVDSWDIWKERGLFKVAYGITSLILIAGAGLIIWAISVIGLQKVELHVWLMFLGSYSTMISYWLVMKRKMNENRW